MKKTYCLFVALLLLSVKVAVAGDQFVLVIDAGHGGHDSGCVGAVTKEKTLTLRYALAFGQLVERQCPDVKVLYTRKTDKYLTLKERADFANNHKANLFVSVHINSLPNKRIARGFQTYTLGRSLRDGNRRGYIENLEVAKRENAVIFMEKDYKQTYQGFDPNSPESNIMFEFIQDKNMELSAELARYLQRNVCQATGRQDMGAHQDNLAVLRLTSMPGCLMELGFISTSDEERFMNDESSTSKYARGFYNAFITYKNKHHAINSPYRPLEMNTPEDPVQRNPTSHEAKEEKAETPVMDEKSGEKSVEKSPDIEKNEKAVFKVQILTSGRKLKSKDARLKGIEDFDCYAEGGLVKYTVGASTNYREIVRLRKKLLEKFPEAFIIAFKNGQKVNVNDAIKENK